MIKYLRLLLLPFTCIYGLIVIIRNWCYDKRIFESRTFHTPIISIGNLDVGGAGKSPMTEYLVRLLKDNYKLATLSRGYGRDTKGFIIADSTSAATEVGDEPAQFKQKFPDVTVAVCEQRAAGAEQLIALGHNLIVLDDAYQHRALTPGLSILLFDYSRVFEPRIMLPAGNMREPFAGRKRANLIIITKCPDELSPAQQENIRLSINPLVGQQLFFTNINYGWLMDAEGNDAAKKIDQQATVFLLTGIANPSPLVKYLQNNAQQVIHHNYADHHQYTLKNITKLADEFRASKAQKKIVITTEKDMQRLRGHELLPLVKQLHILVLPIQVQFLDNGKTQFDNIIESYVR